MCWIYERATWTNKEYIRSVECPSMLMSWADIAPYYDDVRYEMSGKGLDKANHMVGAKCMKCTNTTNMSRTRTIPQ